MGICIVTTLWLAISSNNKQEDTFDKPKAIQKPVLINNPDLLLSTEMLAGENTISSGAGNFSGVRKSLVINSSSRVFIIRAVSRKAVFLAAKKGRETNSLTKVFGEGLHESCAHIKKTTDEIRV